MRALDKGYKDYSAAQYGQYVTLSDPQPAPYMIRESKRLLCDGIRNTQNKLNKKVSGLRFFIVINAVIVDPDTGEEMPCSYVGWKGYFH